MKFSSSFATLIVLLPVLVQAKPFGFQGGIGNQGQQTKGGNNAGQAAKAGNQNQNTGKGGAAASASAASASAAPPASVSAAASAGTGSNDPQSSLTLLQSVIATGFENDGQDQPTAGQVPSLTSSNNFINFCATVPNLPITNGQQIKTGSCNPAPMGIIAATTNMPSSKFISPKNGDTIPANTNFTIQMAIQHLETGHFTNANENYFAAPQVVNSAGDIQGHSHVVIDPLTSLDQTTPTDPLSFVFFKGLNDVAQNGVLSTVVDGGLPAGVYRLASINTAANHQPALVAIAQHGALDDMIYFTVSDDGAAAGAGGAAGAASSAAAASTAAAGAGAASSTAAAASTAAAGSSAASTAAATAAAGKGGQVGAGAGKGAGAGAAKGAGAGAGAAKGAGAGAAKGGAQNNQAGAGAAAGQKPGRGGFKNARRAISF